MARTNVRTAPAPRTTFRLTNTLARSNSRSVEDRGTEEAREPRHEAGRDASSSDADAAGDGQCDRVVGHDDAKLEVSLKWFCVGSGRTRMEKKGAVTEVSVLSSLVSTRSGDISRGSADEGLGSQKFVRRAH